jgi:regulator of CtrA degradation
MQFDERETYRSVESFVGSEVFARLFKEGMMMVEEAAAYLEGPGRRAARNLSRRGALAYAAESMRLTTRLMHIASWLLVQRSVRRREMTPSEAAAHKYSLGGRDTGAGRRFLGSAELPEPLQNLISRSHRLYERAARLDDILYGRPALLDNDAPASPRHAQENIIDSPACAADRSDVDKKPILPPRPPKSTAISAPASMVGAKAQLERLESVFGKRPAGKSQK